MLVLPTRKQQNEPRKEPSLLTHHGTWQESAKSTCPVFSLRATAQLTKLNLSAT